MNRRLRIMTYIIVLSCVLSGCISKDEFFSKNGRYIVEGLNAISKNVVFAEEYYYIDDGYYYFDDSAGRICRYSLKENEIEVILKSEGILQAFFVSDNYIYYDNGYIERYDMETGENICILDSRDVDYVAMQVHDGYIYILQNNDHVYRWPLHGTFENDREYLGDYFPKDNQTGESVQITMDGLLIEGYYNPDEQQYCIASVREQDTNHVVVQDNHIEVVVGGKKVAIYRDRKNQQMPYSYQIEGEERKAIGCLEKSGYRKSELYEQYMTQEGESTIIGLINISKNPVFSWELFQFDIARDMLFRLDVNTGESKIIYDTKDNMTRIIGYNNGIVYLFKDDYKIYSQPVSGGKATEIASIPRSDDVMFDWCGDYLIVKHRDRKTGEAISPLYEVKMIEISS